MRPAIRGRPDHAQRAEAAPGAAVRRGRRRRRFGFSPPRSRCCARAIPASRGTSTRSPACSARPATRVDELQCGTHAPTVYEVRGEVPPPPPYSPLAHNCSGKHSGMLACCVHCGCAEGRLPRLRPSAAAGDPRARSRTSPASPKAALAVGHRRLLGAQLRAAARRRWRGPSRGWPPSADDPGYGDGAARAAPTR